MEEVQLGANISVVGKPILLIAVRWSNFDILNGFWQIHKTGDVLLQR